MSVGEKLRRERLRIGIDLDTLANDTRIAKRYLEAIEADAPSGCPGQFFYRSFVRQYASRVGLDPAEIEREIGAPEPVVVAMPQRHAPEDNEFPLRAPDPLVSASNRVYFGGSMRIGASVLAFVAVVIACSALYATWRHRQVSPTAQVAVQPTPKSETPAVHPSAPPAVPASNPASAMPPPQSGAATPAQTAANVLSTPGGSGSPAQAGPSGAQGNASASNPVSPSPVTSPDDRVVVSVSAKEPAWVALSSDGKPVYTGTLEAAQSRTIGGKERARMRVGNAGGVEVTFNGKPVGPIGPRGGVRVVVFTPEGFHIVDPSEEDDGPVDTSKPRPPTL